MYKRSLFASSLFFTIFYTLIQAQSQYPADISYMIADFKYNKEDGLKICEVQHGSLSVLRGDIHIYGNDGIVPAAFADLFFLLPIKKWSGGISYGPLTKTLKYNNWDVKNSLHAIEQDPSFLTCATTAPIDPSSITSYQGIIYADNNIVHNYDHYHKMYPGILFMNAAILPYWSDKYKMSLLFNRNDELKQYKADWRLYPKKYDPLLAQKIQEDMPSELYVIKPRKEFLGTGVIIVASEDLDNLLYMIAEHSPELKNHPEKKYTYWYRNTDDSFIIEKYYQSDYLCYDAPIDRNESDMIDNNAQYNYDTTMRLAFILQYDCGVMSYHCLGGYHKLPTQALEEEGTLNEKRSSSASFKVIEPELFAEVNAHMEKAMLLLYDVMLHEA